MGNVYLTRSLGELAITILYFERDRMERFSKSEKMRKSFASRWEEQNETLV
jgi:hypothetical protein